MADTIQGTVKLNGVPTSAKVTIVKTTDNSIVTSVNADPVTGAWSANSLPAGRYEAVIFKAGYRAVVEGPWDLDGISSGLSFRYWRLHATANNGNGSYLSIQEIEMRLSLGGADACAVQSGPSATVLASSEANSSNAAWMAFDNTLGTSNKWTPNGPSSVGTPQWIQYDFGAGNAKIIRQFAIVGPISGQLDMAPKDFTIRGSNDGSTWTTTATFTNVTGWDSTTYRTFTAQ